MYRVLNVMLAMLLGAATARASPWWVSWNGDAYPETEGWGHYATDPPAQRWLEDGKLFIDSRADWFINDMYSQSRPGEMTLGPQETFVAHWRVRVDDVIPAGSEDAGLGVASDDQWDVLFTLGVDRISSTYEPGNWAMFTPGVFHEFWFESSDMRTYVLSMDGTPLFQGNFFESLFYGPGAGFGDVTSDRSLSEWDYVECGIIPEPSSLLCMVAALIACGRLRRSAAW
jgi:hypothetical protein